MKKRYIKKINKFINIKKRLRENGLPSDLIYVVMVESHFNSKRVYGIYHGIWQLNPYVGRKFGGIKSHFDLHDINKSTEVIINYFKYLQKQFNNDHRLMIYAYNYGETKIRRLIKKYGKNIPLEKLPQITRNYIPKMMASKIILDRMQMEKDK